MVRVAGAILGLAVALGCHNGALAYTASGDRNFPATLVLPQVAPGDQFYLNYTMLPLSSHGAGTGSRVSNFSATYGKTITDNFGIFLEETYTGVGIEAGGTQWGWQNLDGSLRYLAVNNLDHEFILSLGLDRETGGTGAARVGASPSGATTPQVYLAKGLGDLDIGYLRPLAVTTYSGVTIADKAPRPDVLNTGFTVEYSIPYLQSKVESLDLPDVIRKMTPMTEVLITSPVGRSYGSRTTVLIAPGVSYAGEGWEFAVEALVPATSATGSGVGVTAQLHLRARFPVCRHGPRQTPVREPVTPMKRRDLIRAAALLSLAPTTGFTAAGAGSVVGVVGQCVVQRDGRPTPLKLGDAVAVSDTIEVSADGMLKLRMSDGSVISLAPGTRMTVAAYQTDSAGQRQNAQLSLSQGLIRAVVAPVDHPTTFEVSTAVGTAAVRSTDWFIEAKPGSAQVGVLSGNVVLRSGATRREVAIPARWGARLEAGRDPVEARVWAPQEFQAVISRTDVP